MISYAQDLTSCSIVPVNVNGSFDHYSVEAYGLLPNGQPKNIDLSSASDVSKVNDVLNNDSFSWSGTMYRTWMIWKDAATLNRIDFQTSVTPSGNIYRSWSASANTKILTLKSLIESK